MPATSFKRLMRSLAQLNPADLDRDIQAAEAELERKGKLRSLLAELQGAAGDGARPAVTKRQAIVDFLKGRRAPMAAGEIAQALSLDRGLVQNSLSQMQERKLVKRAKEGGWEAA